MSILINKNTRLLVQGITGNEGLFHTTQMVAYGRNAVAGVTPGKGGEWVLDGKIHVFDSIKLAADATGANCTVQPATQRLTYTIFDETAAAGPVSLAAPGVRMYPVHGRGDGELACFDSACAPRQISFAADSCKPSSEMSVVGFVG